jgi:hypothetical protein
MPHEVDLFARALTGEVRGAYTDEMADLVRGLTCYAKQRMGMVERQLRRAYGDRPPGSYQRWLDQQPERDSWERRMLQRRAWALYRRVHGEPCQAELDRLKFEAEQKAKGQGLHAKREDEQLGGER